MTAAIMLGSPRRRADRAAPINSSFPSGSESSRRAVPGGGFPLGSLTAFFLPAASLPVALPVVNLPARQCAGLFLFPWWRAEDRCIRRQSVSPRFALTVGAGYVRQVVRERKTAGGGCRQRRKARELPGPYAAQLTARRLLIILPRALTRQDDRRCGLRTITGSPVDREIGRGAVELCPKNSCDRSNR